MALDLAEAIRLGIDQLSARDVELPDDLWAQALRAGIFKAGGDLSSVNREYHDAITRALISYFESGRVAGPRNDFKRATIQAFGDAFDAGWTDGGQDLPVDDEDALSWLEARLNTEFGFIDQVFQQAKELRGDEGFDPINWISDRADGYTQTVREVYNAARLRAMDDIMVTFDGDDGAESCDTCQSLKGARHHVSWFIKRNYVPPYGSGLDCARGGRCQHGLMDDDGNWVTV